MQGPGVLGGKPASGAACSAHQTSTASRIGAEDVTLMRESTMGWGADRQGLACPPAQLPFTYVEAKYGTSQDRKLQATERSSFLLDPIVSFGRLVH